jgi:hypothetical protein
MIDIILLYFLVGFVIAAIVDLVNHFTNTWDEVIYPRAMAFWPVLILAVLLCGIQWVREKIVR